MKILGVRIDPVTRNQALERIKAMLEGGQHFIVTPNPEIIMAARKNWEYCQILNKADLSVADGSGIVIISRLTNTPVPQRITGTDLVPEICRLAAETGAKVAFLGGKNEPTVKAAAQVMRQKNPKLNVCYAGYGVSPADWNNTSAHEKIIAEIGAADPDVLFVAFGHPKQEIWIERHRNDLPKVKIFMGVGGALDFIAGSARRAPYWMQKLSLEWLWRLGQEPRRLGRIATAIFLFPLSVFYEFIFKKSES